MKRTLLAVGASLSVGLTAVALWSRDTAVPPRPPVARVAAAGRVEPASEERVVAAEATGRLTEVRVDEGDRVVRGQVLAVIANDERRARVAAAEARLERLLNGARAEERRQARAAVREADAVAEHARVEVERRRDIVESGAIGREEVDRAERERKVALARLDAAREVLALIEAEARVEDLAVARAALDEAKALLERTVVRAPIDGVVTRRHRREGESVVETAAVVTVADASVRRVRAEIDETDVARVAVGQRATVTADAFGGRRFAGRVLRVGLALARKEVLTEEPAERRDTKVLEALIELEDGHELPLNLRVDVYLELD
jgi:multidrug resistance efflux pump